MVRIWFKDGSYIDVIEGQQHFYEMDPELQYIELVDDETDDDNYVCENGNWRKVS